MLLRHITERALAGDTHLLKERTLGVEVFGRRPEYDTNADPVVRGAAGEIRKKLAQYYQDPQHHGETRIELHPGSYVPTFHSADPAPAPSRRVFPWRVGLTLGLAAVVLISPMLYLFATGGQSDLDRFWGPMLDAPGGVLFCLGQSRVYSFRSDSRQKEIESFIESAPSRDFTSSQEMIPLNQLVPEWDRYIALGDANCLLGLVSVFQKHGKPYRIRSESATTFSDLREQPSILIGAFDNGWTMRLVGEMRFTFYKDFQGLEIVRDRDHPEQTSWKLVNSWPNWDIPADYAIVSRVIDRTTDRMVVVAAGITHFGTAGAGDFLSHPAYFAEVAPKLPHDWPTKNLQIVLRVPVVQGTSGHPQVLATHVW
ncbi:MAG TPA: hypothetical protein VKT49_03775 [Bryobacteraceae bacterium]|nr:hypothetical protein [Bryobacteraceae bacterium]